MANKMQRFCHPSFSSAILVYFFSQFTTMINHPKGGVLPSILLVI